MGDAESVASAAGASRKKRSAVPANSVARGDADAGASILLPIEQIQPYERDPRHAPNVEYQRIKASIRADGLGQPLVVTQRPGAADYVVHAGGNTRLRILKELFAETGESRFGSVVCFLRVWTCEADVLLAHLKENDLRGELTFLDKALAVADAKALLKAEFGEGDLSQRCLLKHLAERGYGLSQTLTSQLFYAVERLLPMLPRALKAGLGRPQVARMRALDRAAGALWLERGVDVEEEYDVVFEGLCARYDGPDWDVAVFRRALEGEIAERADVNIHAVSLELDARLAGRAVTDLDPAWCPEPDVTEDEALAVEANTNELTATARAARSATSDEDPQHRASRREDSAGSAPQAAVTSGEAYMEDPLGKLSPLARSDVKSLRARLWTLASRLAQRHGLGDLIEALPSTGLGYVLRDVPDPALVEQLDEDALAQISMVWWTLAACAEVTVAPLDALLPTLPDESVLKRALVEQDAGLLFASVWTLDPGHMGYRLWRRLDDRDWRDLLGLMDTYRTLHRTAADAGHTLWSSGA